VLAALVGLFFMVAGLSNAARAVGAAADRQ
jgi:hypothetical protein